MTGVQTCALPICRKKDGLALDYHTYDIYKNNELYISDLKFPLLGNYQKKNLATIICALDILKNKFDISQNNICDGLLNVVKATGLMGRWQVINKKPLAIADTGHNVAGINEVKHQLAETKFEKLHFVLSVVNDKDIEGILELLPKDAEYYYCKADIPRGLSAEILAEKATNCGLNGKVYNSVKEAYAAACNNAKENDLVFVGGSNFTVAEVV